MNVLTQEFQVIEKMREEGGFATLKRLNEIVDFSKWKTKTPEASVRRIVQQSKFIFRIEPGLWALEEYRDEVLQKFELKIGNKQSEEQFTHGYYQGMLVEIGNINNFKTYIPAQDKNRKFISQSLGEVAKITSVPIFTYDNLLKKARTIDVIWFNERDMPSYFYEVEHTTDIKNSLSKFYELQDFYANFFIVANNSRKKEYEDKIHASIFDAIRSRVVFLDYNRVVKMYEGMMQIKDTIW